MFDMSELSIWTEKYRPKDWSEVVGQTAAVDQIAALVASRQLPHLLLAGPAGCGKSTVALIIAHKLFGPNWKANFLETNASDERGIAVIRSKIKDFARTRAIGFPYKLILLDEADSLTPEAQAALRRMMETYAEVCRFCLSANYSSHIIDAIQSRCAVFRFRALTPDDITARLRTIAAAERLDVEGPAYDTICRLADGDIRKAINLLQAAAASDSRITEQIIYNSAAAAQPADITAMLDAALAGRFDAARARLLDMLLKQGVAGQDILKEVAQRIWTSKLPEAIKAELAEKVGEYEWRLGQGGDEQIQLVALLAQIAARKG